jgi:hypothetical protein
MVLLRAATVLQQNRCHALPNFLENRGLAAGTINGRLAAVRRLAYEAADAGLLSPELAASIRRVKGAKKLGVRIGIGLPRRKPVASGRLLIRTR